MAPGDFRNTPAHFSRRMSEHLDRSRPPLNSCSSNDHVAQINEWFHVKCYEQHLTLKVEAFQILTSPPRYNIGGVLELWSEQHIFSVCL